MKPSILYKFDYTNNLNIDESEAILSFKSFARHFSSTDEMSRFIDDVINIMTSDLILLRSFNKNDNEDGCESDNKDGHFKFINYEDMVKVNSVEQLKDVLYKNNRLNKSKKLFKMIEKFKSNTLNCRDKLSSFIKILENNYFHLINNEKEYNCIKINNNELNKILLNATFNSFYTKDLKKNNNSMICFASDVNTVFVEESRKNFLANNEKNTVNHIALASYITAINSKITNLFDFIDTSGKIKFLNCIKN